MTPEEITALVNSEISKALAPLTQLTESLSGLGDRLAALESAPAPVPAPTDSPADGTEADPLLQRLTELERQLNESKEAAATKEREASKLRLVASVDQALDRHSPNQKSLVRELLIKRYEPEAKETKASGWQVKGKTIAELTEEFFKSPEGQYFLPSNYQDGLGIPQPQGSRSAAAIDLDAALMQAFG